jgi:hypothetical protein
MLQSDVDSSGPISGAHAWLLFLPQPAAATSSLRVQLWRRMRAAGALAFQRGAWILPHAPEHERFLRERVADVEQHGGSGYIFVAAPLDASVQDAIFAGFAADRSQEYAEFAGRCRDFLEEVNRETRAQHYSFAELEEIEQELHKLARWLRQIRSREFFTDAAEGSRDATASLMRCRKAFDTFARAVYAREGLDDADDATVTKNKSPTRAAARPSNSSRSPRNSSRKERT